MFSLQICYRLIQSRAEARNQGPDQENPSNDSKGDNILCRCLISVLLQCQCSYKRFQVPQQRNDEDCGNFVLYYINLFLESAPENFSISKGYPYFVSSSLRKFHTLTFLEIT